MFLIVQQHIHETAGLGYCPEVVGTASLLSVAQLHAAAAGKEGVNVIGIYKCSAAPMGQNTTARPVRRVLGGYRLGDAEPVVWCGDEPHYV